MRPVAKSAAPAPWRAVLIPVLVSSLAAFGLTRLPVFFATPGWASLLPSFSWPWCYRPTPATPEKKTPATTDRGKSPSRLYDSGESSRVSHAS